MADRETINYWISEIGPRVIGGRYYSAYWGAEYDVIAITLDAPIFGWAITCAWSDGRETTHSTAWAQRDRIIFDPEWADYDCQRCAQPVRALRRMAAERAQLCHACAMLATFGPYTSAQRAAARASSEGM